MAKMYRGNVIIVGGNHHNGLNLSRILGINKYRVICLVICDQTYSFIQKSKFATEVYYFKTVKEAFDFALSKYSNSSDKFYLLPYSDSAAFELDNRLDEFSRYFIVPSIGEKQGMISYYMDKKHQYNWAISNDIKIAKTLEIVLDSFDGNTSELKYPLIIKPIISAEGDKKDISICSNKEEFDLAINAFFEKKYNKVIIQEFLKIDFEIDVFGCICKNEPKYCFIPTKTLRSWPVEKGTNSFSQIITDEALCNKCLDIIEKIGKLGFVGLFDLELFVVNGDVYLNEINFRNSGDDYMGLRQKFYYPIFWIRDCELVDNSKLASRPSVNSYAMTPTCDFRHVISKKISFFKWFKDFLKTKDYAIYFFKDKKPFVYYYLRKVREKIRVKKR